MNTSNIEYIDSHCHLELYKDYKHVIKNIEQNNTLVVAVTNIPSVFGQDSQLLKSDNVVLALGLHPQLVKEYGDQIDLFVDLLPKSKFIGEVGLDYQDTDINIRKRQQKIFERILEESSRYKNKVLSVHSRRASEDVVSMIGNNFPGKIILHWYSGSTSIFNKALTNGYFFSINPQMVTTGKGREIIQLIPIERILTESDGPFIKIKGSSIIPSDINIVIDYLSIQYKKSVHEVKSIIYTNFLRVLGTK